MASQPRFFSNNDGSFLLYCSPPMTVDDFVYEAVGRYLGTQVDAIVCHMFGFGCATPLFPTEVPEASGLDFEQVDHVSQWRQQQDSEGALGGGAGSVETGGGGRSRRRNTVLGRDAVQRPARGSFEWENEFSVNHTDYKLGDQCASESTPRAFPVKGSISRFQRFVPTGWLWWRRSAPATMWMGSSGISRGTTGITSPISKRGVLS